MADLIYTYDSIIVYTPFVRPEKSQHCMSRFGTYEGSIYYESRTRMCIISY